MPRKDPSSKPRNKSSLRTKPKYTSALTSYILWELKLNGDVNENHVGGHATKALCERVLESTGCEFTYTEMASGVNNLRAVHKIQTVGGKGQKTRVIRLATLDDDMPPQPLEFNPNSTSKTFMEGFNKEVVAQRNSRRSRSSVTPIPIPISIREAASAVPIGQLTTGEMLFRYDGKLWKAEEL